MHSGSYLQCLFVGSLFQNRTTVFQNLFSDVHCLAHLGHFHGKHLDVLDLALCRVLQLKWWVGGFPIVFRGFSFAWAPVRVVKSLPHIRFHWDYLHRLLPSQPGCAFGHLDSLQDFCLHCGSFYFDAHQFGKSLSV